MSVRPGSAAQPASSRSALRRSFLGDCRIRLHVVAGEALMSTLPEILRQLNYVETLAPAEPIDGDGRREVCLLDASLPDALDLCRALPDHTAKILASTAGSFTHRRDCAAAGVDALIGQPIDARELADWLEHFDDHGTAGRATVLVVDDDDLAAEAVAALLATRGIDAEVVGDPTGVFEVLDRRSFDLVLMDVDMPQVNGIDLARMIRLNRSQLSVPIVFLSADGDTETQMRARRFGGDDFISKRIPSDLLARLVEMRVERARVLRALIERDGLTGLVDHLRFVERIGQELARSRRTGSDCTLVMIDIDHFKAVNDTHGHQAGDLVLRRLASALVAWLRRTDVVGRYGGEEFGVLMLDTPPDRAAPVIDAFRRHFAGLDMISADATFRVSFSAGVAGSRPAADTAALIAAADEALYRAKSEGRDRVVLSERGIEPLHAAPLAAAARPAPAPRPRRRAPPSAVAAPPPPVLSKESDR